ncbi:MAG TPA: hypothetical protein VHN99_08870 [Deinococcales bacterium]|nr:hypothetical protein [Deinococcales bacterium]
MLKLLVTLYAAVGLAVQIVEAAKGDADPAAAREQAVQTVRQLVTAALGTYPWWLPDQLVGAAIDQLVALLHASNVFQHAA